jgi:DNA polymerase-1
MTLLIDGDIVLYQHATAVEEAFDWGDDLWTLHADASEAKQRLDYWVKNVMEKFNAGRCIFALTGNDNWRLQVMPSYKAHRKTTRKPVVYKALKEYIRVAYRVYETPTLEADDVLGLLATGAYPGIKEPLIVVSADKDLKTIPCRLYNPNDDSDRVVSVEEANWNHLYQTLVGDASDGYPGCPGVGAKTAAKLLDEHGATWETVVDAYTKAGLNVQDALRQARVARILRKGEYSLRTNKVKLWSPTTNESRSPARTTRADL